MDLIKRLVMESYTSGEPRNQTESRLRRRILKLLVEAFRFTIFKKKHYLLICRRMRFFSMYVFQRKNRPKNSTVLTSITIQLTSAGFTLVVDGVGLGEA